MTKPLITRRRLLITGALGIGAFSAGYVSWINTKETDIIIAILKRRLGRLRVEDGVFEEYSKHVVENRKSFEKQLKILGVVSGIASIITPYSLLPMGHPLRRLENYTVSNFLLSTDFFQNGADENKPLNYLGFYDPYKRPCANFFPS